MWIANLRIDYFENARGKFIRTDYDDIEFNEMDELETIVRNYELAADEDNCNCDVKIQLIKEK